MPEIASRKVDVWKAVVAAVSLSFLSVVSTWVIDVTRTPAKVSDHERRISVLEETSVEVNRKLDMIIGELKRIE